MSIKRTKKLKKKKKMQGNWDSQPCIVVSGQKSQEQVDNSTKSKSKPDECTGLRY